MTPPRPLGEKERIIERRLWVMIKKRKGKALDDITAEWNQTFPDLACSRSTIAGDIRASLKKSVEETNLATVEWRQLHIERIEKVLSGDTFQKKLDEGDLFTIDRFDKLEDKLIKLSGAYAPTKIAQTDVTGTKDTAGLTNEERMQRIKELMALAEERKKEADFEAEMNQE